MKLLRTIFFILFAVVLTGCAPIKVTSGHDKYTDFSYFETYAWGNNSLSVDRVGRSINHLIETVEEMARRDIQPILDAELANKGFQITKQGNPDFIIQYTAHGRTQSGLLRDNWSANEVTYLINNAGTFLMGSLTIDIIDPATNQVIWRGYGETVIKGSGTNNTRLKRGIHKIMREFPPKD